MSNYFHNVIPYRNIAIKQQATGNWLRSSTHSSDDNQSARMTVLTMAPTPGPLLNHDYPEVAPSSSAVDLSLHMCDKWGSFVFVYYLLDSILILDD